ncbi:MAG: DUF2461 domain-containing protein [Bacteroidia bacterium]|nr:DUF2461 domain-containing protein [Bacteroidia bacterium]MDW8334790.1 DUF2461 domain-containing protein [Bacteroidia bacterium]
MVYFDADLLRFFRELAQNNEKPWFEANKERYLRSVKQPFERFVMDFQRRVLELDPGFPPRKPAELIFRIHRDVRFSKDKSPYKTHAGAYFAAAGKTSQTAGFYIQLGPDDVQFWGGVWNLDKERLNIVRRHIVQNGEELNRLTASPEFAAVFKDVQGECVKNVPKEWADAPQSVWRWLKYKQFLYGAVLPAEICFSPRLMREAERHFLAARPVNRFFNEALFPAHRSAMNEF